MRVLVAKMVGPVIGGFFVLLPLALVGVLLGKIYTLIEGVVHPLLDASPGLVFHTPGLRVLAVLLVLLLVLMITGLLARTQAGRNLGLLFESGILRRLPFYSVLRNLASGLAGKSSDGGSLRPVLVTVNPGIRQFGLLVERNADGSATIFFPSSPTTGTGSVMVVDSSLICELRAPGLKVFQSLGKWGLGASPLLPPPGNHPDERTKEA